MTEKRWIRDRNGEDRKTKDKEGLCFAFIPLCSVHIWSEGFMETLEQKGLLGCLDTADLQTTMAKIWHGWHTYLK